MCNYYYINVTISVTKGLPPLCCLTADSFQAPHHSFAFLSHYLGSQQDSLSALSFGTGENFKLHKFPASAQQPSLQCHPLNILKTQASFLIASDTCSFKSTWTCLETFPVLPRKSHYVSNKPFHNFLVCV